MDPPRKFRLQFQNHPPTRSQTRIRASIEPSVELLPAKSGQPDGPGGVVGRSANCLMALSKAGAYWISSIRSGSRRSAAKRAGSRCALPRVARSSRLTICRSGSAQRRSRELLPTCRGPRNSQTGNSLNASVGHRRISSWVLRNPMFGNIAMHCIFAKKPTSLPMER